MSPGQEVPAANAPNASGTATLTINNGENMRVLLETTGLGDVQGAHIHLGKGGSTGPILFTLYTKATDGAWTGQHTKTLLPGDLQPQADVTTWDQALQAIRDGRTYVNIHTTQNASGELRGQVGLNVALKASLNGAAERPNPVAGTGSGTGEVKLDRTMESAHVVLDFNGLTGPATMAHIHVGGVDVAGPVIFDLGETRAVGGGRYELDITPNDLKQAGGIASWADFVRALLEGGTYLNVHTAANPGGEIRGQLKFEEPMDS